MSTLRLALQLRRIARTRERTQTWWHLNQCKGCAERAAKRAAEERENPLARLFAALNEAPDEMPNGEPTL